MIKKIVNVFLIVLMFFTILFPISAQNDDDKTLQDLIDELNAQKAELKAINQQQALTKEQIQSIRASIAQINRELITIDNEIERLIEEIRVLNIEIKDRDAEIKRVINQHQLSNGNNVYVEYVMGASSVTDFIFRLAIVEQVTEYNKNLIDSMNQMIVEAEEKNIQLENQKVAARKKREELYAKEFSLGQRAEELGEHERTIEDEINDAIKTIENYKKYFNCQPHQRLKDCTQFPVDSNFVRPVAAGTVTSNFGWRNLWGTQNFHIGIDIARGTGEPIYPVANGVVVFTKILNVSSLRNQISGHCWHDYRRQGRPVPSACVCGGQMLVVQHNVNGQNYASRYIHMNQIQVKVGERVTRSTQIGKMGGAEFYDHCSSGAHLHLEIAEGVYGQNAHFARWGTVINPREKINFPARGVTFFNRW